MLQPESFSASLSIEEPFRILTVVTKARTTEEDKEYKKQLQALQQFDQKWKAFLHMKRRKNGTKFVGRMLLHHSSPGGTDTDTSSVTSLTKRKPWAVPNWLK